MEKLREEDLEITIVTIRKVWLRRNVFIFDESFQSPCKVILSAKGLKEFQKA